MEGKIWLLAIVISLVVIGAVIVLLPEGGEININDNSERSAEVLNKAFVPIPFEVDGDRVFINDSKAYISAPNVSVSGPMDFELLSKNYAGGINVAFLFNNDDWIVSSPEYYNPTNENRQRAYTCNDYFNYTTNPKHFYCYVSWEDENNVTNYRLKFDHEFESANQSTNTAYWTEDYVENYKPLVVEVQKKEINFLGLTRAYIVTRDIQQDQLYKFRITLTPRSFETPGSKYWIVYWPEGETIEEAILNGHLYALDPWTQALNANLVDVYLYNETSAADPARDSNNDNRNMTFRNMEDGDLNGAGFQSGVTLDGVNEYMDSASYVGNYGAGDDYTTCSWFKITNLGAILMKDTLTIGAKYNWLMIARGGGGGSTLGWDQYDGALGGSVSCSDSVQNNTWLFGCGRHEAAGNWSLFLSGDHCDSDAPDGTPDTANEPHYVGRSNNGAIYLTGDVDSQMIWERALSDSEIVTIFSLGEWSNASSDLPPNVTLNFPVNTTNATSLPVTLNCTASDDQNLVNVTFMVNGGSNYTNSSPVNDTQVLYDIEFDNGVYNWTCLAYDNATQSATHVNWSLNINVNYSEIAELITPVNATNFTIAANNFTWNSSVVGFENNFTNATISIWFDNNTLANSTAITLTGNDTTTNSLNISLIEYDNYIWNAETCSAKGGCSFAISNRTFIIHLTQPAIEILYPNVTIPYIVVGTNLTLNWTPVETGQNLSAHIANCSYTYNGATTPLTTSECMLNETSFTYVYNVNNLTMNITDVYGFINSNITYWTPIAIEYDNTFNPITTTTGTEEFIINFTGNGTLPVNQQFFYNGTAGLATLINLGGNNYSLNTTQTIPALSGTYEWFFNFDENIDINSTARNQTATGIVFAICNATYTVPYLNFTFADETDLSEQNASNDLTDVDYYTGGGAVNTTYITSNATEQLSYTFCFSPPDETVFVDMIFKYSATGYPLRTFAFDNQSLTNSSILQTLYLLADGDGIYSTIQVVTTIGVPISGVQLVIERQIAGVWIVVGLDNTGDDGASTFWVNPGFQHRITATRAGYNTAQVIITPSQSIYTLTLSSSSGDVDYSPPIDEVRWVVYPGSGTLTPGVRDFNATVTSATTNLQNCSFALINASNLSHTLNISYALTNSSYCFMDFQYNSTADDKYFGRLSLNTTASVLWAIVDADWKWIIIDKEVGNWRTITSFFSDLADIPEFGEGNKAEFNRIILYFAILTLLLTALFYFTGLEINNPGISLIIIFMVTLLASAGGFLTFDSGSDNISSGVEQWAFVFITALWTINYFLASIRRETE